MINTKDRLWVFNNPDKLFWCQECNGYFLEDTDCWCDRVTHWGGRITELDQEVIDAENTIERLEYKIMALEQQVIGAEILCE